MAGFELEDMFFMPRNGIIPPESLQRMIFPFVDETFQVVLPTRTNFIKFMKILRIVILQDMAIMLYDGLNHHLSHLDVFQTAEFKTFASDLDHFIKSQPQVSHQDQFLPPAFVQKIDNAIIPVNAKLDSIERILVGVTHGII